MTRQTFRDHLILEYEILKYDGDLGRPNVFMQIAESHGQTKVATLMDCFESQKKRYWFTEDTFWSMLRVRGVEAASSTKYAEAFYGNKLRIF